MAIVELTTQEQAERTAAYMRRTLSQLRDLARTMGIDPQDMSKAQLTGAIVSRSAKAQVEAKHFDMSGLYVRVGYTTEAGR